MPGLNRIVVAIGSAIGLSVAVGAYAQNQDVPTAAQNPNRPADAAPTQAARAAPMTDMRLSQVIGMKVRNAKGDDLGEINDVVLDVNNNRVHYAILSFGGFAGLGDKLFAYPVRMLHASPDGRSLLLNVSEQQLERAPGFENKRWPRWSQRDDAYRGEVERYFGGETVKVEPAPNALLRRASQVLDADVHDNANKDIGDVEDIVVNMGDGAVRYVAVDFDGAYAGEGDRLATLPMQAFSMPKDDDGDLQIRVDQQALRDVPRFEKGRWPDMADRNHSSRVERWFAKFGDRTDRAVGDAPVGQQRDRSQQ